MNRENLKAAIDINNKILELEDYNDTLKRALERPNGKFVQLAWGPDDSNPGRMGTTPLQRLTDEVNEVISSQIRNNDFRISELNQRMKEL